MGKQEILAAIAAKQAEIEVLQAQLEEIERQEESDSVDNEELVRLELFYIQDRLTQSSKDYLLLHYGNRLTLRKSWTKEKIIKAILVYEEKRERLDLAFGVAA